MIVLRLGVGAVLLSSVLLASAGRLDAWGLWAWPGVIWLIASVTYARLARVSPGLLQERLAPPSDRDRATRRLVALPFLAFLVLSGLDARFGWSAVPLAVQLTSLALVAAAFVLVGWVLLTNPFASSAVRVQDERGHQVIRGGPYALVRHPMYLATLVVCLASGPAVGSWVSGLALLPVIAVFLRRTRLEDGLLHAELPGYADYAAQVRWRVVPLLY